ncbi:MAG: hypothetical protein QXQ81_03870 [Candidatus Thorarchaeota archaeon]
MQRISLLPPRDLLRSLDVMIGNGFGFASWTSFIKESQIRALLKYNVKYYFAGGKPGIVPIAAFAEILRTLS